uniref:Uncharacterized protein MANES_06G012400 n=1 Tax=Rhizophora mucronata TaxID=61149 RepID=A0A2P2KJ64_RHIMU
MTGGTGEGRLDGMLPLSHRKRRREDFDDEDDDDILHADNKPTLQKKVRFPKGKKGKPGNETVSFGRDEFGSSETRDPRQAATERAKRRSQIAAELFSEELNDVSIAEVTYEDDDNFVEDGIQIEPFNLQKEREEGYFDAQGNFVEYINENEMKDPWLDSVAVDTQYAGKSSVDVIDGDDDDNVAHDLSSDDIGIMKRRIANVLEPGETVLQALRRLKGGSNKKEKMSVETQLLFDQLTEDANKLLDHGEYDVYNDKQEVFDREAEGYERLAQARMNGTTVSTGQEDARGMDMFSNVADLGATPALVFDVGTSKRNVATAEISGNDVDPYDIFAEDDDNPSSKPLGSSDVVVGSNSDGVGQSSSDGINSLPESESLQNDYVYDETSGYSLSLSLSPDLQMKTLSVVRIF